MPEQDNTGQVPHQPLEGEPATALGQGPYDARGLGILWLVWSEKGLIRLDLPSEDAPKGHDEGAPQMPIPNAYREILDAYFAGKPVDPCQIPVDLRGTSFQVDVWTALRRIPRGAVRTYAGIASDVGRPRGMRAVGMANARNPISIVVPCHRVVEQGNRLGGYTGGLDRKRLLLELEGVVVEGEQVLPGQLDLL